MTTERVPDQIPTRIYCCPLCEYRTPHRWALARHLRSQHHYTKRNAKLVASESEYWLQPRYYRVDEFGRTDMVDTLEEEDEE
ncbi:hypothetical protein ES707_07384 [subsurface metagenome]